MTKGLPRLSPETEAKVARFYSDCSNMLDTYIGNYETDFNRHAVKHGAIPEDRAVFDMTRDLVLQVRQGAMTVEMLAGLLTTSVVRGIAKKRSGGG